MSPMLSILLILLFTVLANSQNFSLTLDFQHRNLLTYWDDATQNSDHIELTKNSQNSISRVYYTDPVHLFDSTNSSQLLSFSTSFTFQIVQYHVYYSDRYYYTPGDGMAFIMSPNNAASPFNSSGRFLGLFNSSLNGDSKNHLLAVEFDTFRNPEFQDLSEAHIGIDVNNLTSLLAVVPPDDLKLSKNLTLTAWIDYMAASNLLQVRLSTSTTKPEVVMLNLTIDLSKVVKETMYVGFSASTGNNYFQLHKLYSWNFSTSNSSISAAIGPVAPRSSRAPPPLMLNAKKKKNILVPVIAALSAALICISLLLALGWICYKKRKLEASTKEIQLPITRFTYTQLKAATKNFSPEEMLGKGGFGKVYKGVLADGNTVAVKVLFQETIELQLVAELSVISHLRHRNLLSLTGWCYMKEKLLLVYDYMSNGNLHNYLFDTSKLLSWQQRYDIVLGVAEGLAYLHTGWEQKIVHRDVKASNVLLDRNFRAHLGDFGLAKLLDYDKTEQTMTTAGTFGYIAPELVYTGKASDKSDVYSFGILILEVGSGRKVLDIMQGKFLLEWIWLKNEECKLLDVADPKLKMSFDAKEMKTILLLGLLCCQEDPRHRPSMRKCCNILKGSEPLPQMQSLVYINSNQSASVSASSSSPLSRTQPNSVLGTLDGKP